MTRFALALMPLLAVAQPAAAAPSCRTVEQTVESFAREYGESPQWIGATNKDGETILILTSPDGNWSLLRTVNGCAFLEEFGLHSTSFPKGNV